MNPTAFRLQRASASIWMAAGLTALAASSAMAEELTLDCVIDPSQKVNLGSPVTGLLADVQVSRGDFVKAGDVVARIESSVEAATVQLGTVQAQSTEEIDAQRTRLKLAQDKLTRARALADKGHVTTEQVEQAQADENVAEREVARLIQQKRIAELDLGRAQALLAERTIRSPISGFISERKLSPGEFVNQDSYIVTIVALSPLYVETYVPVAQWGQIQVGAVATVGLEQPIGGSYKATVKVVDRLFDAASGTFGVRLELPNADGALPAGQRCHVTFAALSATDSQ